MSATPSLAALLADLDAESMALDRLVASLADPGWRTMTPAAGWTVAHQIAHLAWTDEIAHLAVTDPAGFTAALAAADCVGSFVDVAAAEGAAAPPAELLDRWRTGRAALAAALSGLPADQKVDWFGPRMSPASMVTARLMETWAHGLDVADALGVTCDPTPRLRHVAHLAVRTLQYAFVMNGRQPPTDAVRVELIAPDGQPWSWGPADAADRVTGPALDFCLRMTQRRHRDDLALVARGPTADAWLDIGQAFAGPPGAGRSAGQGGQLSQAAR